MTDDLMFDRALAGAFLLGPAKARGATVDQAIAAAGRLPQRHAGLAWLDDRAWPPARPLGLTPRALRVVAVVAMVGLAVAAAIIGARLLTRPAIGAGSLIVWVPDSSGGGVVRIVGVEGTTTRSFELPPLRHCPQVLPDQQHVAYWRNGTPSGSTGVLVLKPLDGSPERVVEDTTFRDPGTEIWSPDGWRVALRFQTLRVVDASNGTVLRPIGGDGLRSVTWSPSGDLTVARQLDGEVAILAFDLASSATRELFRFPWDSAANGYPFFSWSPDGRYILYSINQYADVVAFDTKTGSTVTLLTGGPGLYDPAGAWSADGRVALVNRDGQVIVARPDGTRLATVRVDALRGLASIGLRWAPDGSSLALTDWEHVVVTTDPDGTNQQAYPQVHVVGALAWSPDSSRLAVQISGADENHAAEVQIELYSPDGLPVKAIGPFTSKDGGPGGSWACLAWEARQ